MPSLSRIGNGEYMNRIQPARTRAPKPRVLIENIISHQCLPKAIMLAIIETCLLYTETVCMRKKLGISKKYANSEAKREIIIWLYLMIAYRLLARAPRVYESTHSSMSAEMSNITSRGISRTICVAIYKRQRHISSTLMRHRAYYAYYIISISPRKILKVSGPIFGARRNRPIMR